MWRCVYSSLLLSRNGLRARTVITRQDGPPDSGNVRHEITAITVLEVNTQLAAWTNRWRTIWYNMCPSAVISARVPLFQITPTFIVLLEAHAGLQTTGSSNYGGPESSTRSQLSKTHARSKANEENNLHQCHNVQHLQNTAVSDVFECSESNGHLQMCKLWGGRLRAGLTRLTADVIRTGVLSSFSIGIGQYRHSCGHFAGWIGRTLSVCVNHAFIWQQFVNHSGCLRHTETAFMELFKRGCVF